MYWFIIYLFMAGTRFVHRQCNLCYSLNTAHTRPPDVLRVKYNERNIRGIFLKSIPSPKSGKNIKKSHYQLVSDGFAMVIL